MIIDIIAITFLPMTLDDIVINDDFPRIRRFALINAMIMKSSSDPRPTMVMTTTAAATMMGNGDDGRR